MIRVVALVLLALACVPAFPEAGDDPATLGRRQLSQARTATDAGNFAEAERQVQLALSGLVDETDKAEAARLLERIRLAMERQRVEGAPELTALDEARRLLAALQAADGVPEARHWAAAKRVERAEPNDPLLASLRLRSLPPWAETVGRDEHGVWAQCRVGRFLMRLRRIDPGTLRTVEGRTVTMAQVYWIGETEVTEAQWSALCSGGDRSSGGELPRLGLSVDDILCSLDYLKCLVNGVSGRLPTADEWEYAARAGTIEDFLPSFRTFASGVYERQEPEPVKRYTANAFGLYDVHGSAWELCRDADGTLMRRGGGWRSRRDGCRLSGRSPVVADGGSDATLGFRLIFAPALPATETKP